jgi:hypothetical protein
LRCARRGVGFAPQELDAIAAMHAELVESLRLGWPFFCEVTRRSPRRVGWSPKNG